MVEEEAVSRTMEKKMNIVEYMTDKQIAEVVRQMPDGALAEMAKALVVLHRKMQEAPPGLDRPVPPDIAREVPSASTGMGTMKKEHTNAFRSRIVAAFNESGGSARLKQLKVSMRDKVTGREVDEKRLVKSLQEMKAKGKLSYLNGKWYCT